MRAPFYLVGPTAVGKTEIAVRAAELCGAEILNADAFQVYEGLDRLTAKPSRAEMARAPHHMIGHISRTESYNVARYHAQASAYLEDAARRGCPVIVVGGSGLYVKSLTHGLSPLPPAQSDLRADLERMDRPSLIAQLVNLDPVAATTIDLCNKRRLIRAVEVCLVTGGRFSELQTAWNQSRKPVHGVFLIREKGDQCERIDHRANILMEDDALDEVREALSSSFSDTASKIIGLAEIGALLAGEITRSECLERIRMATRRYAKRQLTWFRGETFEETINLTIGLDPDVCAKHVAEKIGAAS